HPLCIEVNEKFVFCYLCDDFVLNDNAPGDIKLLRMALDAVADQNFEELYKQKRGRRILRYHMRNAKRATSRLLKADDIQTAVMRHRYSRLSWALRQWWSIYVEKKRLLGPSARLRASPRKPNAPLTFSPAFTGLRNLGNTCYMNSVLQVLRHTAPFANFVMSHAPSDILPSAKKRRYQNATSLDCTTDQSVPQNFPCCLDASTASRSPPSTPSRHSAVQPPLVPCASVSDVTCSPDRSSSVLVNPAFNAKDPSELLVSGGGLNGGRCASLGVKNTQEKLTATSQESDHLGPRQTSIYEELYSILRLLWSGQRTVVSPSNLLYSIWTALPAFKGYRQQDAEEFLSVFLDRLQSEMHSVSGTAPLNSRDFVNRTFQGHSVSHVRCSKCNVIACTEEPFSELSLALPPDCYNGEATECSLQDLLNQFFSPTPIDGRSYACRECNSKYGPAASSASFCPSSQGSTSLVNQSQLNTTALTPYKVDKLISVSLSRLPTPPSGSASMLTRASTTGFHNLVASSPSRSDVALSRSPSDCGMDVVDESSCVVYSSPNPASAFTPPAAEATEPTKYGVGQQYLTRATQTIRLTRLPRVLRLHVKRFRWIGRQREKVGCHVSFPLILDLSDFMLNDADRLECPSPAKPNPPRQHLYHLTGVIVHHGRGFQSGHYTAYCLNDEPECWLSCNDANVSLCDYSEVAAAQAYLLFYSELMPASPYPNWLTRSNVSRMPFLKRCYSTAFPSEENTKPAPIEVTGTPMDELVEVSVKLSPTLKRTTSTPALTTRACQSFPASTQIRQQPAMLESALLGESSDATERGQPAPTALCKQSVESERKSRTNLRGLNPNTSS
ncbi:ubiquitin carboxyl-terminal hydrolase 44/49, partial [Clonorchis sinensis]